MKKAFVVMLVLFLGVANLYAQQAGQFTVGGRMGAALGFHEAGNLGNLFIPSNSPGWGTLGISPLENNGADQGRPSPDLFSDGQRVNFTFAVYGNYAITNNISIQMELKFMAVQGYELRFSAENYPRSWFANVSYTSLDIPILFRYSLLNSQILFGFQAGPHISIPLGRLAVTEDWDHYVSVNRINERFAIDTRASFGLTTGIFAGFQTGPGRVVGDLRFIFDFNSMQVYDRGNRIDFITRRALSIAIGYQQSF